MLVTHGQSLPLPLFVAILYQAAASFDLKEKKKSFKMFNEDESLLRWYLSSSNLKSSWQLLNEKKERGFAHIRKHKGIN